MSMTRRLSQPFKKSTIPENTLSLIRGLARQMPDRQIARLLSRAGKPTGRGNGWTEPRVRSFRCHHGIAVYRDGEWAERGELRLEAAAQIIGVTAMSALRVIQRGVKGDSYARALLGSSLPKKWRPSAPENDG